MKILKILALWLVMPLNMMGQGTSSHTISAPETMEEVRDNHLKLGGTDGIGFNNLYMTINGQPVIPIIGEFHFSRYPHAQWEQEIRKMKAGGVSVIATYIFWNMHEEREGQFRWTGDYDLRRFIRLCGQNGMKVIVRIGPFCHGEIRNGGLPDWLYAKPLDVRSNHPLYLQYVRRLYEEIGQQLQGLFIKDGGPIIGCQLENELQHSAAQWALNYLDQPRDMTVANADTDYAAIGVSVQDKKILTAAAGEAHLRTLKQMAQEAGIVTPFYTATGWGNAAIIPGETLPVTAAYDFATWTNVPMSPFCLFKNLRKTPDYAPVRYRPEDYPSFSAEMGVGIQMVYNRRPVVTPEVAEAMMVRTVGSGANGIGYYMYHGGTNQKMEGGVLTFSDDPAGVPRLSYDFQAPLGEFGLEHPTYRALRPLHAFLTDFQALLAPMQSVFPEGYEQLKPSDRTTLRWAVRMKDGAGFVFMVNAQDHDTLRQPMRDIQLELKLKGETLRIPQQGTFTLAKDANVILPFNLPMEDALLKYATAQPLMKMEGEAHYIFFAPEGIRPEYVFSGVTGKQVYHPQPGLKSTFTVKTLSGKRIRITTLTRQQAENACRIDGRLLITEATVVPGADGSIELLSLGNPAFDYTIYQTGKGFQTFHQEVPTVTPDLQWERVTPRRLSVHTGKLPEAVQVNDYFLSIDYTADVAQGFLGGSFVLDHFYHGRPWQIGLNRFREQLEKDDLSFYFRPLRKDAPFLKDLPSGAVPSFENGSVLEIRKVTLIPQYRLTLPATAQTFWLGADVSGQNQEQLALMKDYGIKAARLRVWVNPKNGWCDKQDVLRHAQWAKALGMEIMLCFHYSDTWADPGKQFIPEAWKNHSYAQMKRALANHTIEVCQLLRDNNIDVRWIQVGNETTHGFLWPMGRVEENMMQYVGLSQAGCRAAKKVYPQAQTIIHLDAGSDIARYRKVFDAFTKAKVDYDLIGMSVYPYWDLQANLTQNEEETLSRVIANIKTLHQTYGKEVMIVETGYEAIRDVEGYQFISRLIRAAKNDTDGHCHGVFYWAPELEGHYALGAFDNHRPTRIMNAFADAASGKEIPDVLFTQRNYAVQQHDCQSPNGKIWGQLYLPFTSVYCKGEQLPLVILAHGFGASHEETQRYAEVLASQGIAAYVFDFCGSSMRSQGEGKTPDMNIFTEQADLEAITAQLKQVSCIDPERVMILGCSQGALVSSITAAAHPEAYSGLILICPDLGIPFTAHEMLEKGKFERPVLVVYGDDDDITPPQLIEQIKQTYKDVRFRCIEGGKHGFPHPFHHREAERFVLQFAMRSL